MTALAPREPRRELNPRIAGRDKWKRIEVISRLKTFLSDPLCGTRPRNPALLNPLNPTPLNR